MRQQSEGPDLLYLLYLTLKGPGLCKIHFTNVL